LFLANSVAGRAFDSSLIKISGAMQFNKSQTERAKEDVKKAMKVLNDHLLHHTFLVGERISLADIAVACTMFHLYQHVMDPEFRYEKLIIVRKF